ncbi:MAG: GAF domain-containing protein, partial [Anaerolineae bacterium]|nr:GAF domain-containing protein [Anaerolineae bacterium]
MHRSIRKTWLPLAQMFILLCILVWLDEILDLPHLLLGAPPTPINWREALGETALVATVGFLAVSRLVRDVTARVRAEKEIQRRTAQLEALQQVGLELTAQLNLDTLLHFIVSQAIELAGGAAGGLDLYRPERDLLERAVAVGYGVTPLGIILHRGEGLSGKVWETGEPLIVDDYHHWEGRAAGFEDYPFTASVGVPVRWGEKFLGVLHVASDSARTFSPADAESLSLFATQAAVAIRNTRLYEEVQQELAERKRA